MATRQKYIQYKPDGRNTVEELRKLYTRYGLGSYKGLLKADLLRDIRKHLKRKSGSRKSSPARSSSSNKKNICRICRRKVTIDNKIKNIILDKSLNKHEKMSSILYYLFVKIAKISQDKYYILGSYALRKYRHINDLDINLDHDEFFKLQKPVEMGFGHIEIYNNQIRWFFDFTKEYNKLLNTTEKDVSIEAFQKNPKQGYPNPSFSLSKLKKQKGLSRDENGHNHMNLKTLLKWKTTMGRNKDKQDIELIKSIK